MKKNRTFIDSAGNEVKPFSHEVVVSNEPQYTPTKEELEKVINLPKEPVPIPAEIKSSLSIQDQIAEAEKHLASLKIQKQEEIKRRREELAKLEAE